MISPLAAGSNFASLQNQHHMAIFNTTVARNLRGRTNSNLNQMHSGMKGQIGSIGDFNLTNNFQLNTISPQQVRVHANEQQQKIKKHGHGSTAKMGVSGS